MLSYFDILVPNGWAAPAGAAFCVPYVLLFLWTIAAGVCMLRAAQNHPRRT
ncbi:hypothetical protein [Streptomyces spectabilis]|uniref:Uncharacterized protein n=1 Tax=Streptomyces spectabilis TaxID=68270 RepID=A0A7W8B6U9_STRST|nr:hypothetical protein [Streptomyces spectabilis]MBB5109658.1 hypothetical protein [Streptomyces spectabilis]GGV55173.1 hypothetical protein GCM10010245_87350 [Streptomyces spectabilis]